MPDPDDLEETVEVPAGHVHVYRGIAVRVLENTIGGHVINLRPADRATQKRARRREVDKKSGHPQ